MAGRFTLVVCLLAFAAPGIAVAQSSPRDPVALANEGATALNERRFGDALESYDLRYLCIGVEARQPVLCIHQGIQYHSM